MIARKDIIEKFIDVKYTHNGRDIKTGLDCWGLIMLGIKDIHNIQLPDANYQIRTLVDTNHRIFESHNMEDWVVKTEVLKYGDLILFYSTNDLPIHVGLYIGKQQFIHSIMPHGTRVEEIDRYKLKIAGYYRLRNKND